MLYLTSLRRPSKGVLTKHHAAIFWPKTATALQFLSRNSRTHFIDCDLHQLEDSAGKIKTLLTRTDLSFFTTFTNLKIYENLRTLISHSYGTPIKTI